MKKELFFVTLLLFLITLFFFYPVLKGFIPLPGELLMSGHQPYKSYSLLGYPPGGVPNKGQGPDVIRILFPWKHFSITELLRGSFPLWNPYNFSGNTHFANLQSGTLYPFNIVFFVLPFLSGWTVYIMLEPFLAAFLTYLLLREIKIGRIPSLFGGVVFAFSGFMVVWQQYGNFGHTLLWLPLVLLLIHRYVQKPKILLLVCITSILSVSILAGYIQLAIYMYLVIGGFSLMSFFTDHESKKIKKYFFLLCSYIAPFFLCAVQFLPLIEVFQLSARNSYSFSQLSERLIPPINLITLVFPDFFGNPATRNYWLPGTYIERTAYIGIVPLFFVLCSWYARERKYTKFFLFVAIASYLSALDVLPMKLFHAIGIPFLSTGVPSRILGITCFALAVLSAIGFDSWLAAGKKGRYLNPLFLLFGIVTGTWLFVLLSHNPNFLVTKRNLILPTALFLFLGVTLILRRSTKTQTIAIALVVLSFLDLFYFFHKITPFSPSAFAYPQTSVMRKLTAIQGIDRSWGYGDAFFDADIQLMEKIYSTDGYDPLFSKRYAELISASDDGKIDKEINRTDVNLKPGYGESDLKENRYRKRLLDLLGVKYILHKFLLNGSSKTPDVGTFPEKDYSMVWQENGWQIYENKSSLPRLSLVSSYTVKSNKDDIIKALMQQSFSLHNQVVLERILPKDFMPAAGLIARVKLLSYQPNKVTASIHADHNTILLLTDNYFPGWQATVDGQDMPIYRADYSFRAVPIPKGKHIVAFQYKPKSFQYGFLLSILSFIILISVGVLSYLKKLYV